MDQGIFLCLSACGPECALAALPLLFSHHAHGAQTKHRLSSTLLRPASSARASVSPLAPSLPCPRRLRPPSRRMSTTARCAPSAPTLARTRPPERITRAHPITRAGAVFRRLTYDRPRDAYYTAHDSDRLGLDRHAPQLENVARAQFVLARRRHARSARPRSTLAPRSTPARPHPPACRACAVRGALALSASLPTRIRAAAAAQDAQRAEPAAGGDGIPGRASCTRRRRLAHWWARGPCRASALPSRRSRPRSDPKTAYARRPPPIPLFVVSCTFRVGQGASISLGPPRLQSCS
jgi:hypothetical protein